MESVEQQFANQQFDKYTKRGDLSSDFWKRNRDLISKLSELSDQLYLDIRLRGGLIHVYYRGGKILEIRPKCLKVEEKYLRDYPNKETLFKKWFVSKNRDDEYKCTLNREAVLNDLPGYLADMKEAMDSWFKKNSKDERKVQQFISVSNQNQILIVDIEFAVSFNSHCYNVEYISKQKQEKDELKHKEYKPYKRWPNPRFDIVGIDDNGQIYVFELKTGLESIGNMPKHITDFVNLIGSKEQDVQGITRYREFNAEMANIISTFNANSEIFRKDKFPNVNEDLPPKFYFLFTDKDEEGKSEFLEFQKNVDNCYNDLKSDQNAGLYQSLIDQGILNENAVYTGKSLNHIINLPK